MTAILGYADGKTVWMAGDSFVGNGSWDRFTLTTRKVVRRDGFLIGVSGLLKPLIATETVFQPPARPENLTDDQYMFSVFYRELKTLLDQYESPLKEDDDTTSLLVGYRGRLYKIGYEGAVYSPREQIISIGSGGDYAQGAFMALRSIFRSDGEKTIESIMLDAMEVTVKSTYSVAPPFYVERLDSSE